MELTHLPTYSPKYESIPDGSFEEGLERDLINPASSWSWWKRWRVYVFVAMTPASLMFLILVSGSFVKSAPHPDGLRMSDVPFDIVEHPETPTKLWGDRKGPLPTGAFWTNFVVESGDAPANLHPYGIKCVEGGIQVSYNPTRRVVNELVISDPFDNDLQITADEEYVERAVSDYDSLSVSMKYTVANEGAYTAHLVKGAAFVTVSFDKATPVVKAPNMQIINAELRDSKGKRLADVEPGSDHRRLIEEGDSDFSNGVQYLLDLGNFQKWLVYVSDPAASLIWDKAGNKMTASGGPASDVFMRIAILPPRKDPASVDAAFAYLLKYVHNYPVGASVDIDYDKSNTFGVMSYHFATEGLAGRMQPSSDRARAGGWWWNWSGLFAGKFSRPSGQSPDNDSPSQAAASAAILMYALPHHVKALDQEDGGKDILSKEGCRVLPSMYSLKGPLTPVVGSTWTMKYHLADKGWDYYVRSDVPSWQLDEIANQLIKDVTSTSADAEATDSYNFGKEISRLARLAGIADYLGITDIRTEALVKMKSWLTPWLEGTNEDTLVYDKSYGGVVTSKGLADYMADFGLGYYNDHHFHYGYFVYSFAMISRFDPGFLAKHQPAMDAVAHDICSQRSPSSYAEDEAFPYVRHKDFFDGHSWASGIFSMSNGKGQESSSEATNAYYACYLYGMVKGDDAFRQHSQFMLTLEVEATKLYWHMPNAEVYDAYFASNAMVGNVGAFDVTSTTWFGSNLEYVHGIQIMPVTPASGLLLEPDFVSVEWPLLANRLPPSQRGISIVSRHEAVGKASNGTSSSSRHAAKASYRSLAAGGGGDKACNAVPKCAQLGLTGECCPNPQGAMLDCCGSSAGPVPHAPVAPSPGPGPTGGEQPKGEAKEEGETSITEEWRAVLFMDMAVVDRESAYEQLTKLTEVGPGASKTNALMWAVSRPNPMQIEIPPHEAQHVAPQECKYNSACDATGVLGNCCPGDDGAQLQCCPKVTGAANTRS